MNQFVLFRREPVSIKCNHYRLVAAIRYDKGIMFVRFVGTHRDHDRINAEEV